MVNETIWLSLYRIIAFNNSKFGFTLGSELRVWWQAWARRTVEVGYSGQGIA